MPQDFSFSSLAKNTEGARQMDYDAAGTAAGLQGSLQKDAVALAKKIAGVYTMGAGMIGEIGAMESNLAAGAPAAAEASGGMAQNFTSKTPDFGKANPGLLNNIDNNAQGVGGQMVLTGMESLYLRAKSMFSGMGKQVSNGKAPGEFLTQKQDYQSLREQYIAGKQKNYEKSLYNSEYQKMTEGRLREKAKADFLKANPKPEESEDDMNERVDREEARKAKEAEAREIYREHYSPKPDAAETAAKIYHEERSKYVESALRLQTKMALDASYKPTSEEQVLFDELEKRMSKGGK